MWPFKKRNPPGFGTLVIPKADLEQARARMVLEGVQRVVKDFASTVQDNDDPIAFYDVISLPHSKELIESSLVASIKLADGRGEVAYSSVACVMLEALTQYQEGVGKVPIRGVPETSGLSPDEAVRAISAHAAVHERWETFNRMADTDRARYAERLKSN